MVWCYIVGILLIIIACLVYFIMYQRTKYMEESLKDKMISNVREVSTGGGNIFAVVNEGDTTTKEVVDDLVYIPKTIDILTPLISVVPLQLISYYVAKQKGCDVDKPRNLAKSVTVE